MFRLILILIVAALILALLMRRKQPPPPLLDEIRPFERDGGIRHELEPGEDVADPISESADRSRLPPDP